MSHDQPMKPQVDHEIPKYSDVTGVSTVNHSNVQEKCVQHQVPVVPTDIGSAAIDGDPITIGEALEAVAISAGDKAVDQNDAAEIRIAEIRASGEKSVRSGCLGEMAQEAATFNSQQMRVQDMTKLSDILTDATEKLPADRAVTREDAEAVYALEREAIEVAAEPGGVAASMATAANLNKLN
ncbi:unnamed protein product [Sphenostylis stenocarpa]|uniref:SMP domain-containing protein n=1 Tax=Sphenostylis stenocarpa TaxID=92480 RepID=A0AA86T144_9FABA|nr:unnamed protein product [Sphenostylis stenocarpa]